MGVGIRGRWGWSWGVDERGGDGAASLTVATALSFSYQQLPKVFLYLFKLVDTRSVETCFLRGCVTHSLRCRHCS